MDSSNAIFGDTLQRLEQALDMRALRHRIISSNIANIDTPGYKAFDVVLKDASDSLERLKTPDEAPGPKHFPISGNSAEPQIVERSPAHSVSFRGDNNTVDLDIEMTNLSENSAMFEALARIVKHRFQALNDAITGGGGRQI